MKIQIKSIFGNLLFESDFSSVKEIIENSKADLRGADLGGADLGEANLYGADKQQQIK
jgi:uncharacterized protein YjbI with pentapeptide repeats